MDEEEEEREREIERERERERVDIGEETERVSVCDSVGEGGVVV